MIKIKDFTEFEPVEFEKIKVPFGFFNRLLDYISEMVGIESISHCCGPH